MEDPSFPDRLKGQNPESTWEPKKKLGVPLGFPLKPQRRMYQLQGGLGAPGRELLKSDVSPRLKGQLRGFDGPLHPQRLLVLNGCRSWHPFWGTRNITPKSHSAEKKDTHTKSLSKTCCILRPPMPHCSHKNMWWRFTLFVFVSFTPRGIPAG